MMFVVALVVFPLVSPFIMMIYAGVVIVISGIIVAVRLVVGLLDWAVWVVLVAVLG